MLQIMNFLNIYGLMNFNARISTCNIWKDGGWLWNIDMKIAYKSGGWFFVRGIETPLDTLVLHMYNTCPSIVSDT